MHSAQNSYRRMHTITYTNIVWHTTHMRLPAVFWFLYLSSKKKSNIYIQRHKWAMGMSSLWRQYTPVCVYWVPSISYHSLLLNWISFKLPSSHSPRRTAFQYRHHHLALFSPIQNTQRAQADYIQVSCRRLHIKSDNGIPLHTHTHMHTLRLVLFTEVCEIQVSLFPKYQSCDITSHGVVKLFPSKYNMRNKCWFLIWNTEYSTNCVQVQASAKWTCSEPNEAEDACYWFLNAFTLRTKIWRNSLQYCT